MQNMQFHALIQDWVGVEGRGIGLCPRLVLHVIKA